MTTGELPMSGTVRRNNAIDILKGIGILLVIIGHTYGPLTSFIYLFHMPIFFMSAGYCFSYKYTDSFTSVSILIKKRLKSLWLPYAIVNTIFILLNNIFLQIGFYSTDERLLALHEFQWDQVLGHYYSVKESGSRIIHSLLFNQSTQLTGATWFLEVLFFAAIGFAIIDCCVRKTVGAKHNKVRIMIHFLIAILCLIIGSLKYKYPILGKYRLATILIVLVIFEMGLVLKQLESKISLSRIQWLLISLSSGAILIGLNGYGHVELSSHDYSSIVFLLTSSILGWLLVYGISYAIAQNDNIVNRVLCFYGQNTLPILLLHLVFFKPVTAYIISTRGLPNYLLASFPVLTTEHGSWIAYAIVNIALCTVMIFIWSWIKGMVKKWKKY